MRLPVRGALSHALLIAFGTIMLYPFLWLLASSLKPNDEIFSTMRLLPSQIQWQNYTKGWYAMRDLPFSVFTRNSFLVSGLTVLGTVASASLVAYGFARCNLRYILFKQLGWISTFLPLVVPPFFGASAFFIFLLVQFMRGIPKELDDAAAIDGCSPFQTFSRIILPLCTPALVVAGIYAFLWSWNDFLHPLIYLSDPRKFTIPLSPPTRPGRGGAPDRSSPPRGCLRRPARGAHGRRFRGGHDHGRRAGVHAPRPGDSPSLRGVPGGGRHGRSGGAEPLRSIPVFVDLARTMESVCPDAWLINLTNPVTTICRAVAKTSGIKVIGLCHEVDSTRSTLRRMFGVAADELEVLVAGVNHLPWCLDIRVRGEEGVPLIREYVASGRLIPLKPDFDERSPFQDHWKVKLALLDVYGYLPGAGDRHVAEFFPYFLTGDARADFDIEMTPIDLRERRTAVHRDQILRWLADDEPVPLERSREEFSDVIVALRGGPPVHAVVNMPNRGQVSNLPRDAVLETTAMVSADGVQPVAMGEVPAGVQSTLYLHILNQEMIVGAALRADRRLSLQALLADPLVRDFHTAPAMLEELLRANAEWLPQF